MFDLGKVVLLTFIEGVLKLCQLWESLQDTEFIVTWQTAFFFCFVLLSSSERERKGVETTGYL